MITALDLGKMSTAEKLRLMEELWENLSSKEESLPSPAWHGAILAERERLISSGEESYIDWEVAKNDLRSELR